jgi:hypothetical protein
MNHAVGPSGAPTAARGSLDPYTFIGTREGAAGTDRQGIVVGAVEGDGGPVQKNQGSIEPWERGTLETVGSKGRGRIDPSNLVEREPPGCNTAGVARTTRDSYGVSGLKLTPAEPASGNVFPYTY